MCACGRVCYACKGNGYRPVRPVSFLPVSFFLYLFVTWSKEKKSNNKVPHIQIEPLLAPNCGTNGKHGKVSTVGAQRTGLDYPIRNICASCKMK